MSQIEVLPDQFSVLFFVNKIWQFPVRVFVFACFCHYFVVKCIFYQYILFLFDSSRSLFIWKSYILSKMEFICEKKKRCSSKILETRGSKKLTRDKQTSSDPEAILTSYGKDMFYYYYYYPIYNINSLFFFMLCKSRLTDRTLTLERTDRTRQN